MLLFLTHDRLQTIWVAQGIISVSTELHLWLPHMVLISSALCHVVDLFKAVVLTVLSWDDLVYWQLSKWTLWCSGVLIIYGRNQSCYALMQALIDQGKRHAPPLLSDFTKCHLIDSVKCSSSLLSDLGLTVCWWCDLLWGFFVSILLETPDDNLITVWFRSQALAHQNSVKGPV